MWKCPVKENSDFPYISFIHGEYLSKQPLCPSANLSGLFLARNVSYAHTWDNLWEEGKQTWLNQTTRVSVTYGYSHTHGQAVERLVENIAKKSLRLNEWVAVTPVMMTETYQQIQAKGTASFSVGQECTYHTQMRVRGMAAMTTRGTNFSGYHGPRKYQGANDNTWSGWHSDSPW